MSPLSVQEVIAELNRAGRPVDHQPGENGVSTTCPCCPGVMSWVDIDGWRRWICDSGCDNSRIGDALHFEATGPTYNGNGPPEPAPPQPTGRRVMLTAASSITPERVEWLWASRVTLRGLSLLAGEAGLGKSTLTAELAAQVTRGTLPGALHGQPADVAIATAEDHFASVVWGRLVAAGADLHRVHRIHVEDPDGTGLTIPDDLDAIRGHCRRLRDAGRPVALVIADPVAAFIGGHVDTHRDASVRRVLAPLAEFAESDDLAVVGVAHLNKQQAGGLLSRVGGSVAFGAAPRSVLAFARHPDDPDGDQGYDRVIVHAKTNHGVYARTIAARIEGRDVPEVGSVSRLVIVGESDIGASDLQGGRENDASGDDVEEAIVASIADGARPSRDVKGQVAAELTCARKTVERAAVRMRDRGELTVEKGGFPPTSTWALPVGDAAAVPIGDTTPCPQWTNGGVEPNQTAAAPVRDTTPSGVPNGAEDALFAPNGDATCGGCGARLTHFGGRLACFACTSGGAS